MSIQVERKNDILIIHFLYSADRVKKIKLIPGHRYNPEKKCWSLPFNRESIKKLERIFYQEKFIPENIINSLKSKIITNLYLEKMQDSLDIHGYSYKTKEVYLNQINKFFEYIHKKPEKIVEEDVRSYILYLLDDRKCSHSYVNQALSSLKVSVKTSPPGKVEDVLIG